MRVEWGAQLKEVTPRPLTMRDLAQALGVSQATASKAFSGNGRIAPATREMVLEAARKMGFEPNPTAQRLANRRNNRRVDLFALQLDAGIGVSKLKRIQGRLAAAGYDAHCIPTTSTRASRRTRRARSS